MNEQTSAELIAEARGYAHEGRVARALILALVERLEAAERERDLFKREHDAALIEGLATEAGYSLVHHEEAEAFLRREARQRREGQP